MSRAFFFNLIAITITLVGVFLFFEFYSSPAQPDLDSQQAVQTSAAELSISSSTPSKSATSTPSSKGLLTVSQKTTIVKKASNKAIISTSTSSSDQIERIQQPYSIPPESFDTVNSDTRNALVNILCEPEGGSSLNPISGSGILIDPKGIILTNAHVAQYVLLSESPAVDLKCYIRTGSPAAAEWTAAVLYIPPVWVAQHANEITDQHPTGTGEHDYAFLYITSSLDGSPLPSQFPYLPIDTRPAIGFPGDQVLVASYPAELVGGIAAQYDLFADTSVTTIKELMTFGEQTPDVVSLGGVIEAQEGSSGGAVVNQWGRLIALIATTSEGTTTSDRDLRGVSLSYIDTDLKTQLGVDIADFLEQDPLVQLQNFSANTAPGLVELYVAQLTKAQ